MASSSVTHCTCATCPLTRSFTKAPVCRTTWLVYQLVKSTFSTSWPIHQSVATRAQLLVLLFRQKTHQVSIHIFGIFGRPSNASIFVLYSSPCKARYSHNPTRVSLRASSTDPWGSKDYKDYNRLFVTNVKLLETMVSRQMTNRILQRATFMSCQIAGSTLINNWLTYTMLSENCTVRLSQSYKKTQYKLTCELTSTRLM